MFERAHMLRAGCDAGEKKIKTTRSVQVRHRLSVFFLSSLRDALENTNEIIFYLFGRSTSSSLWQYRADEGT